MNRQPLEKPPRWWSPKLSRFWLRIWRPIRVAFQRRGQRLLGVDVQAVDHVREAVADGRGVLITPNHASHADCFALCSAADQVGFPFQFMVAWQVFGRGGWLRRMALRHHGCFSVDREGTDMRAFRQAVEILQTGRYPLVIFPEGEVYHCNERITPFREGPAAIALLAARKAKRPVVCIPCAVKYQYLEDPTAKLLALMDRLERAVYWRPRPDLSMPQRIYRLAEGLLALKELEYLGHTCDGPPPERIGRLIQFILAGVEERYHIRPADATVPERVKTLRQNIIGRLEEMGEDDPGRPQCEDDLDDVFFVVQLYSYPGDYVAEQPSVERFAETLDKFEEDVLGRPTATIRGARSASVTFGEPILVEARRGEKRAAQSLTHLLEERVAGLLRGDETERGRHLAASSAG